MTGRHATKPSMARARPRRPRGQAAGRAAAADPRARRRGNRRVALWGHTVAGLAALALLWRAASLRADDWDELPAVARVMVVASDQAAFSQNELALLAGRVAAAQQAPAA